MKLKLSRHSQVYRHRPQTCRVSTTLLFSSSWSPYPKCLGLSLLTPNAKLEWPNTPLLGFPFGVAFLPRAILLRMSETTQYDENIHQDNNKRSRMSLPSMEVITHHTRMSTCTQRSVQCGLEINIPPDVNTPPQKSAIEIGSQQQPTGMLNILSK